MAIKSTELRIGNWVSNGEKQYTVDVNMLYDLAASELEDGGYELFGIPLTPGILEACGFDKLSSAWFEKDTYKILIGWTEKEGDFWHLCDCDEVVLSTAHKHLHQLQNLWYDLNGEELEYKPFKFPNDLDKIEPSLSTLMNLKQKGD